MKMTNGQEGEFLKPLLNLLCVIRFVERGMEELLQRRLGHLRHLNLKVNNNVMAENSPTEKENVALANARMPAETPENLKRSMKQFCGRVPQQTDIIECQAGHVPQESPQALFAQTTAQSQIETKIVNQSPHKEAAAQNQTTNEVPATKTSE